MSRVLLLVEGRTEQIFIREVLAPALSHQGVYLAATLLGRGVHQGGVGSYQRFRREVIRVLRQRGHDAISTMFDYYRLPTDWPGVPQAQKLPVAAVPGSIEDAIRLDLDNELQQSYPVTFLPYIQMHEFEALLFSDPAVLANTMERPDLIRVFTQILSQFDGPEEIDNDPNTAPSKRIQTHAPAYQKTVHGIIAAQRMGLAVMRQHCPHFDAWVGCLEALGTEGES